MWHTDDKVYIIFVCALYNNFCFAGEKEQLLEIIQITAAIRCCNAAPVFRSALITKSQ